jgi:hypothetical protein
MVEPELSELLRLSISEDNIFPMVVDHPLTADIFLLIKKNDKQKNKIQYNEQRYKDTKGK